MLYATTDMARRLEEADKIHLARQVESCIELFPGQGLCMHHLNGSGLAAITIPLFGRKLNHVVEFGMAGPVSGDDLTVVEELYVNYNVAGEIDLCPHADVTALDVLATRGYTVNGWINTYIRTLTDADLEQPSGHKIDVCRVLPEGRDKFTSISLMGYKDGGRPTVLLEALARSAVMRPDTRLYFAVVDGKVAGSAGLALIDTSKGGVAHLYIDSTLPEYRGQGVHAALLRARLADAKRAGFEVASIHARPTTSSARNIERAGFRLAYTKTSFSRRSKRK